MKKIFLLAILVFICMSSYAQLITSTRVVVQKKPSNTFWLDFGAGCLSEQYESGLGVDLGLRWNKHFTDNVSWDIFKINAEAEVKEKLLIQVLTGIRGTTPVLFENSTLFGAVGFGCGYITDIEDGGFCGDMSVGINITPKFLVGIGYNFQRVGQSNVTYNYISLKLGVKF